jgi:nitroreductase
MDADASRARTVAGIDHMRDHFAEIPALIVICENPGAPGPKRPGARAALTILRRGGARRAWRLARSGSPFIRSEGASFYPAAENLLLAARAHGLGACLTSWHLLAEAEFKRVLGIPPDVRTWAIIPIGYPLKPFGPVRRRPVEEAIRWETF